MLPERISERTRGGCEGVEAVAPQSAGVGDRMGRVGRRGTAGSSKWGDGLR